MIVLIEARRMCSAACVLRGGKRRRKATGRGGMVHSTDRGPSASTDSAIWFTAGLAGQWALEVLVRQRVSDERIELAVVLQIDQ
eukprot:6201255-Pleurochrysis_carterae.AAC.1